MNRFTPPAVVAAAALLGGACRLDDTPVIFRVTVENVSTEDLIASDRLNGTVPTSPGVWAVFDESDPIFDEGEAASAALERLAEDGIPSMALGGDGVDRTLADDLADEPFVLDFGTFASPGGDDLGPGFAPGESATFEFQADVGEELQIATMFVQSNDWFIAFGDGGLELFDVLEEPRSEEITDELVIYDAGTEVDTAPGTGEWQAPVQPSIDSGPSESVSVQPALERDFTFAVPAAEDVLRVTIIAFESDEDEDGEDDLDDENDGLFE